MNLNRALELLADLRHSIEDYGHRLLMGWFRLLEKVQMHLDVFRDFLKTIRDRLARHLTQANRALDLLTELRHKIEGRGHRLMMGLFRYFEKINTQLQVFKDLLKVIRDRVVRHLTLSNGLYFLLASSSAILVFIVSTVKEQPAIQIAEEPAAPEEIEVADTEQKNKSGLIQRFTVLALDAGHGGVDPGSIAKSGLTEKEVTLTLAKAVREKLQSVENLHVALTRYDDRTININSRTEIIKEIGADFVVSLHLNSIPQEHIALVESYYKKIRRANPHDQQVFIRSSNKNIEESKALASAVQNAVFQTVKRHNKISVNAGLKTESMRILSQNEAPGVLIEVTCLSNPDEAERLTTDEYIDKLAESLANGIKEFLDNRSESLTAAFQKQ